MLKSMNVFQPDNRSLIGREMLDRTYQHHVKRILSVKKTIDNKPPIAYSVKHNTKPLQHKGIDRQLVPGCEGGDTPRRRPRIEKRNVPRLPRQKTDASDSPRSAPPEGKGDSGDSLGEREARTDRPQRQRHPWVKRQIQRQRLVEEKRQRDQKARDARVVRLSDSSATQAAGGTSRHFGYDQIPERTKTTTAKTYPADDSTNKRITGEPPRCAPVPIRLPSRRVSLMAPRKDSDSSPDASKRILSARKPSHPYLSHQMNRRRTPPEWWSKQKRRNVRQSPIPKRMTPMENLAKTPEPISEDERLTPQPWDPSPPASVQSTRRHTAEQGTIDLAKGLWQKEDDGVFGDDEGGFESSDDVSIAEFEPSASTRTSEHPPVAEEDEEEDETTASSSDSDDDSGYEQSFCSDDDSGEEG